MQREAARVPPLCVNYAQRQQKFPNLTELFREL